MKVTSKITVEQDVIDDIRCNCCGHSCMNAEGYSPEGLIEHTVSGGYGSKVIKDGNSFTFSICEVCLSQIIMNFVIRPEFTGNLIDMQDIEAEAWNEWRHRAAKSLVHEIGNEDSVLQDGIRKKSLNNVTLSQRLDNLTDPGNGEV